jgi:hypothetical protein
LYVPGSPPDAEANATDDSAKAATAAARRMRGLLECIDFLLRLTCTEARKRALRRHRHQHRSALGAGTEID